MSSRWDSRKSWTSTSIAADSTGRAGRDGVCYALYRAEDDALIRTAGEERHPL